MSSFAQCGGVIVSQWRYALRRHSVIHSGSFLRAEIARTTSSPRPGGRRLGFDVGDEAGVVAAVDRGRDRVRRRGAFAELVLDLDAFGGHVRSPSVSVTLPRAAGIDVRCFGGGCSMSASVTFASALAIAWLMRCQFTRTPQCGS